MNARASLPPEPLRPHLVGPDAGGDREHAPVDRLLDDGRSELASQVVKMMSAPPASSLAAQDFATAALLPCVLRVSSAILRPSAPPFALTVFRCNFADATADVSNGRHRARRVVRPADGDRLPLSRRGEGHGRRDRRDGEKPGHHGQSSCSHRFPPTVVDSHASRRPTTPPSLHERVHRGAAVPDVVLLRLAHQRAGDELDLRRPVRVDVLQHRRVVRRPTPGREDVHLPRVVVKLDAGGPGDRLPSSTSPWTSRPRSVGSFSAAKWGSCRSPVIAATGLTAALKISFDHWAGRRSGSASPSARSARSCRRLLDRRERRVLVRPSHVSVSRMYSTWVSECFVPLANVTRRRSASCRSVGRPPRRRCRSARS